MTSNEIQRKSDIITIGSIANELLRTKESYTDEEMGRIVLNTYYQKIPDDAKIHNAMKGLMVGDLRLLILDITKHIAPFSHTEPIEVQGSNRDAICEVQIFNPKTKHLIGCTHGAWIAETCNMCQETFAVINRLESRRRGAGRAILETVTRALKGMPVYVLVSYAHKGDDELERHEVIEKLVPYFENLGYKNINDQYSYEHAAVMMLENK